MIKMATAMFVGALIALAIMSGPVTFGYLMGVAYACTLMCAIFARRART